MVITGSFGSVTSSVATLTVDAPPSITTQPVGSTNVAGMAATISAVADGTPSLNYQWQLNGTNVDGATNAALTLNNITSDEAGNYTITVTNLVGSVTSSNATLSVYATAAATMDGCALSADTCFQFQVAGVPGFNYAVLASTNMIDWVPLITNTSPFTFVERTPPIVRSSFTAASTCPDPPGASEVYKTGTTSVCCIRWSRLRGIDAGKF